MLHEIMMNKKNKSISDSDWLIFMNFWLSPTQKKKHTHRLIVMKRKLQLDSPMSKAVASAERHSIIDFKQTACFIRLLQHEQRNQLETLLHLKPMLLLLLHCMWET